MDVLLSICIRPVLSVAAAFYIQGVGVKVCHHGYGLYYFASALFCALYFCADVIRDQRCDQCVLAKLECMGLLYLLCVALYAACAAKNGIIMGPICLAAELYVLFFSTDAYW